MKNKFVYFDHQLYKIECIIEKELDDFFNSCFISAYQLSEIISEDTDNICDGLFEKKVVSSEDITSLISRINEIICGEIGIDNENIEYEFLNTKEIYSLNSYNDFILKKGREYRITHYTAHLAENVINNSFSHILGKCTSNNIVDFVSGYAGVGKWVLGKNHKSELTKKFQKNIYQYLKGMLINLKTIIKNELIMEWENDYCIESAVEV